MEEIGKALKSIFDKLSDFFDIFDLSFFVSGFFTTLVISLWAYYNGIELSLPQKTPFIIVGILICYLNGLLSFAVGRWIRSMINTAYKWIFKRKDKQMNFDSRFEVILKAHGLENSIDYKDYLARTDTRGIYRLYVRFWADLRGDEQYAKSLSFLKRYWVMSATYDGLSISILISITLLTETWYRLLDSLIPISNVTFSLLLALLIILFFACIREAGRFIEYQMEELAATIAAKRNI